jgi:thiol-disulfide isomerase/thioredoxin
MAFRQVARCGPAAAAVLAGVVLVSSGRCDGHGVARAGDPAPPFVLQSGTGHQLTLRSSGSRPLVINVFASWCPPCRQELPGIVAAARAHHGAVAFLGVDEQEPVEIGTRFAAALKIPYPVGFDAGQFAASYGASALPETIFVRADGTVDAIHHGAIARAELERRIAALTVQR